MKIFGILAVCLAGGLTWNISNGTEIAGVTNPYQTIATRNAFALQSPALPPVVLPVETPLPRIMVTGTMSIFGRDQVVFKVLVPENIPVVDALKFYVLAEGEQQDGIEIRAVDTAARTVTFNNHGTVQHLSLGRAERLPSARAFVEKISQ